MEPAKTLPELVNIYERRLISEALRQAGNMTNAARLLGISHQSLAWILDGRHSALRVKPKLSRKGNR